MHAHDVPWKANETARHFHGLIVQRDPVIEPGITDRSAIEPKRTAFHVFVLL
jgi:hypothetical protein